MITDPPPAADRLTAATSGRDKILDTLAYARNPLGEAKAELDRKYFPKKKVITSGLVQIIHVTSSAWDYGQLRTVRKGWGSGERSNDSKTAKCHLCHFLNIGIAAH